jgi:hypothetical protein
MIFTTPSTREDMMQEADVYGDFFVRPVDEVSIKETFEFMDTLGEDFSHVDATEAMKLVEEKDRPFFSMFKDFVFYIDCYEVVNEERTRLRLSPLEVTMRLVRHYQGSISSTINSRITHVIMHPSYMGRFKAIQATLNRYGRSDAHIISFEWVHKSIQKRESLAESEFSIDLIRRQARRIKREVRKRYFVCNLCGLNTNLGGSQE